MFDWAGYMFSLVVLGAICCSAVSRQQFERHAGVTTANIQTVMAGVLYRKVVWTGLQHLQAFVLILNIIQQTEASSMSMSSMVHMPLISPPLRLKDIVSFP